jgi:hypothetical protein
MSLHCPARLVVVPPGGTIDLSGRPFAAVYTGPGDRGAADEFGTTLGLRVNVVPALADGLDAAVQEIGDQHSGETVLVVAGADGPMEVEYDGDTWMVVRAG